VHLTWIPLLIPCHVSYEWPPNTKAKAAKGEVGLSAEGIHTARVNNKGNDKPVPIRNTFQDSRYNLFSNILTLFSLFFKCNNFPVPTTFKQMVFTSVHDNNFIAAFATFAELNFLQTLKFKFFLEGNSLRLSLQTPNTLSCNITPIFVTPTSLWPNRIWSTDRFKLCTKAMPILRTNLLCTITPYVDLDCANVSLYCIAQDHTCWAKCKAQVNIYIRHFQPGWIHRRSQGGATGPCPSYF